MSDDENHLIAERVQNWPGCANGSRLPNDFRRDALAADVVGAYGAKSAEALDAAAVRVRMAGRCASSG